MLIEVDGVQTLVCTFQNRSFFKPAGASPVNMREKQCIKVNSPLVKKPITQAGTFDWQTFLKKHLYSLLTALDGVYQEPRYHPEGDALYHSLQVFQLAYQTCTDPELWAAALLHDIGKAISTPNHAQIGANELEGFLSERIVWLIRHHLDLLVAPRSTRRRLRHSHQLRELELLRAWDLKGRSPTATVMGPREAINILIQHGSSLLPRNETAHDNNAFG